MAKLKNRETLVQVKPCSKNSMSGNKWSEILKGFKMILKNSLLLVLKWISCLQLMFGKVSSWKKGIKDINICQISWESNSQTCEMLCIVPTTSSVLKIHTTQ